MVQTAEEGVPAFLALENGLVLAGKSFGAVKQTNGEVGKSACTARVLFWVEVMDMVMFIW